MNIIELIKNQIENLPDGPHLLGLRSVIRHIEAAYRHLSRGQELSDESAFTDAIYRSNQAFEGSIKEAYRVLAEKDPQRKTTFDIEKYLQENNLFKQRVLAQFSNYRTEWRNPATHDYNLDFDEDEAFLAITSVSAFAKLLTNQISEKLAFLSVKNSVENQTIVLTNPMQDNSDLVDIAADAFVEFLNKMDSPSSKLEFHTESHGKF